MIDANTTQNDLETIAKQIDNSDATHTDPLAQRLRDLGSAVVGGDYADAWAAVDVQRLIEPTPIIERFKSQQAQEPWIPRLQWARNILLFFPLIFTGIGLVLAFQAYDDLKNTTNKPFIDLWLNAFDGHGVQWNLFGIQLSPVQWFAPITIVIADFVSALLIIFLIQFVSWLKHRNHRKRTREAEVFGAKLIQVLGDASLFLATRRWQAPTDLVGRFDKTAYQLLQEIQMERERLTELAKRREKEFADLGAFSSGVAAVTTDMLAAAHTLKETTAHLIESLQTFSQQYADVPKQQRLVLSAINNTTQLLQETLKSLARIENRQGQQEEALTAALTQIGEVITHIIGSTSSLKSYTQEYVTQQNIFLHNLQTERDMQNKVALRIISATESTGKVLQGIDESANSLHIMAVDLNKMRTQLVAFLNSMKDEIFGETKETVKHIARSGTSLATAAANIEQASHVLTQTLSSLQTDAIQPPTTNNDELAFQAITTKLEGNMATGESNE